MIERIYKAILLQAFQDLATKSQKPEDLLAKHLAESWLLSGSAWFYYVCDAAGFHPSEIRKQAERIKREGFNWRAAPRQGKNYPLRWKYRENKKRKLALKAQCSSSETSSSPEP